MPKIARQHATHVETMDGFEGRYDDLDGARAGALEVIVLDGAPSEGRLLRGGHDGIAEHTIYWTGIWDGPAIARPAAEAPVVSR